LICNITMRTITVLALVLSPLYLFSADKTKPMVECEMAQPISSRPCATDFRLIRAVLPEYTEEERQTELEGTVVLSAVVVNLAI